MSSTAVGQGQTQTPRAARTGGKILRACVVQNGKVIEEQRLRRRESLTIGSGAKNTFVIPEPSLPRTHELFAMRSGAYELVLTEGMRGKISIDNNVVDVAGLKAQGLLKRRGDYYYLPLSDSHRGKVMIGDVTLIFQFVVPPPKPGKPQLPLAARGSILKSMDWPFVLALIGATMLVMPVMVYVQFAPLPTELTLDTMDDRWAKLIVPERKLEAKKPETKKEGDASAAKEQSQKQASKRDPANAEAAEKARAQRRGEIRKSIAGRGILAILGTVGAGAGSGAVADVFSEGGLGGDLDSAFEGISGVELAAGGAHTTRGGASGEAASIGGLATAGGGKVGLGGKQEARVGSVETEAPEVDGALDSEAIARVVKTRMRMVKDCYERELKRSPTLAGKIEIEFTIDSSGRVESARVSSNRMGSDAVASCIISRLQRWRFPAPDGGSVTVNFPFIFTPSG
ncbi:MAG: AgmX/PglI C-terminal domain-containing protein [Myxococcota bacterium]